MSLRSEYRTHLEGIVRDLRARATQHAPEAAICSSEGMTVTNGPDETIIRIYDEISMFGITASDVTDELDRITTSSIRVELNSPGGNVFDGIAIYNALRAHSSTVTVRVDGLAGSIASVIAQAGDVRLMQSGSQMMIHNASGLTIGDNRDHSDMADLLRHQDGVIAGIYAERSGRDIDEFRAMMNDETWLTDQASVDAGLADAVGTTAPAAAVKPAPTAGPAPVVAPPTPAASTPKFYEIAANANRRRR